MLPVATLHCVQHMLRSASRNRCYHLIYTEDNYSCTYANPGAMYKATGHSRQSQGARKVGKNIVLFIARKILSWTWSVI
ncbi:hypothetical protein Pdw03_2534 [Penicillium digitatum]|uniref:Uncharacterized protein n=1 Tax=Penicillium digitatum TaxID=36651 RepID=A0A7T7BH84_PENDI|nr:hypothetical protein Pdw03_2534 [Penicillium digitatum]